MLALFTVLFHDLFHLEWLAVPRVDGSYL